MSQRLDVPLDQKTSEDSFYWSELADLTHELQERIFGWCACEQGEQTYDDCPQQQGEN